MCFVHFGAITILKTTVKVTSKGEVVEVCFVAKQSDYLLVINWDNAIITSNPCHKPKVALKGSYVLIYYFLGNAITRKIKMLAWKINAFFFFNQMGQLFLKKNDKWIWDTFYQA